MDQGGLEVSVRTNSAWTPKNHKPSREKVFEERLILIGKWYSGWSKEQRRTFLEHILMKCTIDQLSLIDAYVHPQLPKPLADFTRLLPRHLCLKIFSFLDPRSLCRATQVCWYWHYLTEENCIWKPKCLRFGWTLPSPPLLTDMGTWKRHYLSCVSNLHWVPPPPATTANQELEENEEVVISDEDRSQPLPVNTMVDSRKKLTSSRINKPYKRREATFSFSRSDSMLQDKPAWRHPDRFPKNLEQSTILTTSWLTRKHTRCNNYHPSLTTGNSHHIFSPNVSQEDSDENKQLSSHDEESLIESETSQHVRDSTLPKLSLPNNKLTDKKSIGRISQSEMYSSLLKRSGTTQHAITPLKEDTTQQQTLISKLSLYKDQSLPKDTENTVQLTRNPWPIKLDYNSSDNET